MARALLILGLLFVACVLVACGANTEPTESSCGVPAPCTGACASCDDGDPCTVDRCVDGFGCGAVPIPNCGCENTCDMATRVVFAHSLARGTGGIPGPRRPVALAASEDGANLYVAARDASGGDLIAHVIRRDNRLRWAQGLPVDLGGLVDVALDNGVLYAAGPAGVMALSIGEGGVPSPGPIFGVAASAVAARAGRVVAVSSGRLHVLVSPAGPAGGEIADSTLDGARDVLLNRNGDRAFVAAAESGTVSSWRVDATPPTLLGVVTQQPGLTWPVALDLNDAGQIAVAGFCDQDVAILQAEPLAYVASLFDQPAANLCGPNAQLGADTLLTYPSAVAFTPEGRIAVAGRALTPEVGLFAPGQEPRFLFDQPPANDFSDEPFYLLPTDHENAWDGQPLAFQDTASLTRVGDRLYITSTMSSAVAVVQNGEVQQYLQRGDGGVRALSGAYNLTLSADGRFVYVAPRIHAVPGVFALDSETGALTELEPPTRPDRLSLDGGLTNLGLSPDGSQLITSDTAGEGSLQVWDRDLERGTLQWHETVPMPRCGADRPLPVDVEVSPDGEQVFVADFQDGPSCLWVFPRGSGGNLGAPIRHNEAFLDGIESLLLTADGRHVYTVAFLSNQVGHYLRDETGTLTPVAPTESAALEGAEFVAMTPAEDALFVTSPAVNTIVMFARDPNSGTLTHRGTIQDGAAIRGAAGVVVSPDGASLYVSSRLDSSLTAWGIGPGPRLTLRQTLQDLPSLNWVNGLDITPDGRHLVTAAVAASAVSSFRIAPPGAPSCPGQPCP